jgi:hypothetical protein
MKTFPFHTGRVVAGWAVAVAFACAGCSSVPHNGSGEPNHADVNAYSAFTTVPWTVQRVVVLPVAGDAADSTMADGIEALEPLLVAELIKTRKFEVIRATPESTRALTGMRQWTGSEALPADFLETFRLNYGCDAVLFCELTRFRPHPPLAVGWRMKLVDVRTREILWAGDDLFDSGNPTVLRSAKRYHGRELNTGSDWAMERSPRRFGQYAAAQVFATLPER